MKLQYEGSASRIRSKGGFGQGMMAKIDTDSKEYQLSKTNAEKAEHLLNEMLE